MAINILENRKQILDLGFTEIEGSNSYIIELETGSIILSGVSDVEVKHKDLIDRVKINTCNSIEDLKTLIHIINNKEEEEEEAASICDTCEAGMCEICSERHTSSSYQSKLEEAGEYYSNLEKQNIIEKEENIIEKKYNFEIGDTFEYDYSINANAYCPVTAKVINTWTDGSKVEIEYKTYSGYNETTILE